jgi:Tfp pilus assembly protein FimT
VERVCIHIPMKHRASARAAAALVELFITISVIALLSGLILAAIARTRSEAHSIQCMANLKNISVAFSQYAAVNDYRYPSPLDAGQSWESLLERYIKEPGIFACPSDEEVYPSVGSSYDWRDTPDPATTLAGKPLVAVTRGETVLAFETLSGWHQKHRMNALRVNGSVEMMFDDDCLHDLQYPVNTFGLASTQNTKLH